MNDAPTAAAFLADLDANRSDEELAKIQRSFKTGAGEYGEGDTFIGVRMGTVFALAKAARSMPLDEIERLLESPIHEARAGAVRIMAEQAKARAATDADRRAFHDLFCGGSTASTTGTSSTSGRGRSPVAIWSTIPATS